MFLAVICMYTFFFLQVPDNAVMALVPKQVTAYNSVNNSTVSRTSASKYGERASSPFSAIVISDTTMGASGAYYTCDMAIC